MKLYIDNWRWRDVPMYLRTGKRMKKGQSIISICFRQPPLQFFHDSAHHATVDQNWVILGIQPEECIRIEMTVKEPGLEMKTRTSSLDASFRNSDEKVVDAYEDLLLDVLKGDRSLFLNFDEVEHAWLFYKRGQSSAIMLRPILLAHGALKTADYLIKTVKAGEPR
jgi:glucose-6-phosphate 1-dehydrogenase